MAAPTRQHCSVCDAVLSEPNDAVQPKCANCAAGDPGKLPIRREQSGPIPDTAQLAATEGTLIASNDTGQDPPRYNMTVDFVPSSDPTEPMLSGSGGSPAPKPMQVGRFRVIGVLGHGSFGTVYRAYDPLLDREVALKVPRFSLDDRAMLERFHREAKAAARLHHPNLVTLYESGETDDGPFLVTEFVDGVPLSQLLRQQRHDLRSVVDWVRQIAEGLHYAHGEGIVHRDIKPANIMMSHSRRPQVMDFGLAKRDADIESGMTVEGQIVGTPMYMSPEQARGAIAEVGAHSDQYSVGVVLYEMLCGRVPFAGDPWTVIAHVANMHESPPAPRSLCPDLPRDLEACCLKALEKAPKSRYSSLQALADDLDHWLKGLPLVARPIGAWEQLQRWCRKNRLIAGLAGTVAMMIVVATIVGYGLAFRFRALATAADAAREKEASARLLEQSARLEGERVIIDAYTETGLTADRNGDSREAILWFANAVAAAENHPLREQHNRIRMQSWLSQIAIPVQAFNQPAVWNKGLSYHPSGHQLLSLSLSGQCDVLELSSGKSLTVPITGPVSAATWSPDGSLLVVASHRDVAVLDYPSNTEVDRWTHPDPVSCLQFGADGRLLVVGGDTTTQVRDVPNKSFRTGPLDVGSQVTSATISPDGRRFAVRSFDQKVRVFSSAPDQPISEPLLPVLPSAYEGNHPPMFVGNDRLVVVDNHHAIRCWDLALKEVAWEQEVQRVLSSAISPDGRWIALGEDFDVILLDTASGEPTEDRITHPNMISSLSFHPQSSLLLTAGVDHTARIFAVPSGKPVGPPIPHNNAVHRCAWSPDGRSFATVQWDGQLVRVWKHRDLHRERQSNDAVAATSAQSPFVRLNGRGDRWLPSSFDNSRNRICLQVIETASGKPVGPPLSGTGLVSDADFIPNSSLIVLAGGGTREDVRYSLDKQNLDGPGSVRFVNSETGQVIFEDVVTPSQAIAVRTSSDGQTIVVLCHRGQVILLDPATGLRRAEHQAFHAQPATYGYVIRDRIRFSPQGTQFVLWGCSGEMELRKTNSGELLFEVRHAGGFLHDVQFSPDGQLVATCSSDHTVRLWNTATGASHGRPLNHSGWVFNAQFSGDGRRLLTASSDKHARIWDVATGTAVLATREHGDQVFGVTFLPGEDLFLASTRGGQLTAWDATLGKMLAPARKMKEMIYQLSLSSDGLHVLASGRLKPIHSFDWHQWILKPDTELHREDVRLLGEILASQRVHEGGAATSLTSAEWTERWTRFRKKHPEHPLLTLPSE